MFVTNPYGLVTGVLGGGTKMLLLSGVLMVGGVSLAYVVNKIARGGAADAELAYLANDAEESREEEARLRHALEASQEIVVEATAEGAKWDAWSDRHVSDLDRLREQADPNPVVCPANCQLPPDFLAIIQSGDP